MMPISQVQRHILERLAGGWRVLRFHPTLGHRAWLALPPTPEEKRKPYTRVHKPTFDALVRLEWIVFERMNEHTMPTTEVYTITDAGRSALETSRLPDDEYVKVHPVRQAHDHR